MSSYRRIGELLVEKGHLTPDQLEKALEAKQHSKKRFGEVVVGLGYIDEATLAWCLAEQYMMEYVDPSDIRVDSRALRMVPFSFASSHLLLPTAVDETTLHCIVADPLDVQSTDDLSAATGKKVKVSICGVAALKSAINKAYDIPAPEVQTTTTTGRRKKKVDPQTDRFALLDALTMLGGGL